MNRKNNYIKIRAIFNYYILKNNYSIFKVKQNKSALVNECELSIIICIIRNNQDEFLIINKRIYIFEDQNNKTITE